VAALAGDQANSSVDSSVRALRRRAGVRPLSARRGLRDALRFLRDGGCVATLGDQDARHRGIFIDFLGTPASTHTGVFSLARRTGAVVLFGVCVDRDDRRELHLAQPWRSDPDAPEADELRAGAVWYTRALEEEVRQAPDNYFWAHRRWKTPPPQEPPSLPPGNAP
jgi:KDO2-lipid IV(A) lauroyltransferase